MSAEVKGYCPACGSASLFLGSGGYVTCSIIDCPNSTAAADILGDREIHHVVTLAATEFTVRHPLIERLGGALEECDLHRQISQLSGPPRQSGRYRVYGATASSIGTWERLG